MPPAATTTVVSYVPNVYFSFPYIATYFANPGFCSAAVSQCSANYAACTDHLGGAGQVGGGFGVTIVVPGGGGTTITAGAGTTVDVARATSICKFALFVHFNFFFWERAGIPPGASYADAACGGAGNSLSSLACSGLESDMCTLTGTSTDGFYFGTETENAAARPTAAPCAGLIGAFAAGAAGLGML